MWKKRERMAQDSGEGSGSGKEPHLTWEQVKNIIGSVAFRDWGINYQHSYTKDRGMLTILAYFPNREDDSKFEMESHDRRLARSRHSEMRYVEPEPYYSIGSYDDPVASFRQEHFGGALPITGWRDIPDSARESREALIRFIYGMILHLSDHEIRENLYVNGVRVLDPHGIQQQVIEEPAGNYLGNFLL